MKFYYLLVLLLVVSSLHAQKTITLVSAPENTPLQNVLIYHKNHLIGETNELGKVMLYLQNTDSLIFVKNDYEDLVLAKDQIPTIVAMFKNRVISLNEVIISPMTTKMLLYKVGEFMKSKNEEAGTPNYNIPQNLHMYNKFTADKDTLHYLNNRFKFVKGDFKINDQTPIVRNFEEIQVKENIVKLYSWNNKITDFWGSLWLTPLGIHYSADFTAFFYHQDLYNYKITASDDYYKLEFNQKKKARYNIEGYMLVDRYDFGIYEFESQLQSNHPLYIKHKNFSNAETIVFKIYKDTYKFKYIKENGAYTLDYSSKSTHFSTEKGSFKNIDFVNTVQVERTPNYEDKNLKNFDMFKWLIK